MEITKAVVLCAGEGTRLRPLTLFRPKPLLPVAGRPILGWILAALRDAGITHAALVIGYQPESVRQYVGTGQSWGLEVEYISQPRPQGLGHAVSLARGFVGGDPFVVYLGDNLLQDGIAGFVRDLSDEEWEAAVLLKRVENPARFGVAEVDGQRVVRLVEKPERPTSNLAVIGVYAFRESIFGAIERVLPSPRGEVEITDAIQHLVAAGRVVRWAEVTGVWEDAGEFDAVLEANRIWLQSAHLQVSEGSTEDCYIEGAVGIGLGSRVVRCHLIGPCRVGRNCFLSDSVIGPGVSIEDGCHIQGTRLRDCIIQAKSQVIDLPRGFEHSILGEGARVEGSPGAGDQRPLRLHLGDRAYLKVT